MLSLAEIGTFARKSDALRCVIETPKGSSYKYGYDDRHRCLELKKVLPEGMTFPFDFGFIPSTRAGDGDPLDVLVLMDFSALPLSLIEVRLLGAIKAEQKGSHEDWTRNDRLIAAANVAATYLEVRSLDDLRPKLLDEIEAFFRQYNSLDGGEFRPLGRCGEGEAREIVEEGRRQFSNARG